MQSGIVYALFAYVQWGLAPLFFKALQHVSATEIILHRMVWALAFMLFVLGLRRQWAWLGQALRQPRILLRFAACALMITINWFMYVWAVNNNHIVDASLGYFINPLINVMFGFVLLRERLRPAQWVTVAIAALGVAWLTWQAGQVPWIGLIIAFSFATYGLLRKTGSLGALEGLTLETLLLFPFAVGLLAWMAIHAESMFFAANASAWTQWLLVAAGPVTAIPLLMFAAAARRISMSLLGILQYVGPTIQLALGVWLYDEPFSGTKLVGYIAIWTALAMYTAEGLRHSTRQSRQQSAAL